MKKTGFHAESGKSIMELLLVVAVSGILVTFAITRLGNAQNNFQRQNLAREFKVNLERARYDSVKRRPDAVGNYARVKINSDASYSVATDLNQDGALQFTEDEDGVLVGADVRQVDFSGRSNVKIIGTGLTFPITITFDWRGNISAKNAANVDVTPVFYFCEGECTVATTNVSNTNIIVLSETGTVAMLSGGEPVPPYENPTVNNIPVDADVNEWVVVKDENATPTPTPSTSPTASPSPSPSTSPTTSPSPSPSPSPTASPTASPTPTATATPTPNVTYCSSGQRPSSNGCVCKLPMTVRASGKCM